jgi:hypothetical protein
MNNEGMSEFSTDPQGTEGMGAIVDDLHVHPKAELIKPYDPTSDHSIEEFDKQFTKVVNIEMANHYWTPAKEGESMILKYMGISLQEVIDESTGELTKKECVNFVGVINGSITHITNATSRMLQIFKNPIICKYNKYLVTFLGSKPASSSNHKFFDWSVKQVL